MRKVLFFFAVFLVLGSSLFAQNRDEELFGHVMLVESYDLPHFSGFHALIALRDKPGVTIAIISTSPSIEHQLEVALATGNLVDIWGSLMTDPPKPRGGTWSFDVYEAD